MLMNLGLAQRLLPRAALVGDAHTPVERVHSDTRTLRPGDLFVALKGERFDAHDYLRQAREAGAAAALVSADRRQSLDEAGLPGLLVADTRVALGDLAAGWRARFSLPLIAVAGSNGKTTVTQMIASILRAWQGDAALSTEGNLNNDIGVPLTLLRLRENTHRVAVVELGMNHPGEIALLARMAAPSVALVNNAQREHQEFMASVEAVARENGAVIESLGADGTAVFPFDDEHAGTWRTLAGSRAVLGFALSGSADLTTTAQWVGDHWRCAIATPAGTLDIALRVAGLHNVKNAMAATACALAAGCPLEAIGRGLEAFSPVKGRSQVGVLALDGRSVTLIDDSYNANPDSVRAAIDVLAALPAPRWLVLGDMGEVGDQGPAFHAEVGAHARETGIEHLWVAGQATADTASAYGSHARRFDNAAALAAALDEAPQALSVVVKGSRFMKMEQIVAALRQRAGQAGGGDAH